MLWLEQNIRHSITNLVISEPMVLVVELFMDDSQYIVAFHVTGNLNLRIPWIRSSTSESTSIR